MDALHQHGDLRHRGRAGIDARRRARVLGITPSAVSQQIARLERDCAVTLLYRTTRKLTLTEAGQMFYDGCADMLAAARRARTRRWPGCATH